MTRLVAALALLLLVASAGAGETRAQAAAPPNTIPLPELAPPENGPEPEVTIIETQSETVYEYRVNGRLYMVQIQPVVGPPYYLLDLDGDGQMDVRQNQPWNGSLPKWVLFRW